MTYTREEYTPRLQVQIHEIERYATLQVTVNMAKGDLVTDVPDSWVGKVRFRDRFINRLVLLYSSQEVSLGILPRRIFVIGVTRAHLESDVRSYDGRIITKRL